MKQRDLVYLPQSSFHVIPGLDPAAMWFHGEHEDVRLDTSDAFFVDVIHTSSEYGITSGIGHVDFFPNGGKKQPGCNTILAGKVHGFHDNTSVARCYKTESILFARVDHVSVL